MKIVLINDSDQLVPPPNDVIRADLYISVSLAEELQRRGHDVSFLCPKGSSVSVKKIFSSTGPIVSIIPFKQFINIENMEARTEVKHAVTTDLFLQLLELEQSGMFDLIHVHCNVPLSEIVFLSKTETPCLFTLHSVPRSFDAENKVIKAFNKNTKHFFTSISKNQQKMFPSINFFTNIYHGIDKNRFIFHETGGDVILSAGRLRKTKGVKEAILTAIATEKKITVSGASSSTDKQYLTDELLSIINHRQDLIHFSGHIDREMMPGFYTGGKLFLFPIQLEEAFGLVMIESMACGTPVVAFARGSIPEVIKDGETGFIVNPSDDDIRGDWIVKKTGIEGLCEAVERIYAMPEEEYRQMRRNCRAHVEQNFTVEKMVDNYEALYQQILSARKQ